MVKLVETLEDNHFFYLICELVTGGDLQGRLQDGGSLKEAEAAQIIKQLLLGLNFIHKLGIMHRDIKPANIMMKSDDSLDIKITDFGFATFFDPNLGKQQMCGSPVFMAPEIVLNNQPYNHKIDIWAVGIVLFKILNGDNSSPYKNMNSMKNLEDACKQLMKDKEKNPKAFYDISKCFKKSFSDECVHFFNSCLIVDYNRRKSARRLLKHPWIMKHCPFEREEFSPQETAEILRRVHKYSQASKFIKAIISFAIGIGLDEGVD